MLPLEEATVQKIRKRQQREAKNPEAHLFRKTFNEELCVEGNNIFFVLLQKKSLEIFEFEPTTCTKWTTVRRRPVNSCRPLIRLNLQEYVVSLHPEDLPITKMYDRANPVHLRNLFANGPSLYFYFTSSAQKEDWYLQLKFLINSTLKTQNGNVKVS